MTTSEPGRGWQALLVPVLVVVLAALAGAAVMWTVAGRQTSAPAVPVALVNLDQPVTTGSGQDQKTVAAGRQLAAGLTQPDADQQTPLSWEVVDSDDAAAGLRDGGYYAVLTIPADFSKAITSTSGDKPVAGRLQLVTNDASSTAVGGLARLAVDRAASTLGDQATSGFVDQTLQSITTISTNLDSTSGSAKKLASSSADLASSSDDLSDGAASLASGAGDLSDGAAQAADASVRLASGTASLEDAAGQLADGAGSTATGASRVSSAAGRLARGSGAVADQTRRQATNLDRLDRLSSRTASGSRRVADEAARVAGGCRDSGADVRFCLRLRALARTTRVESRAVAVVDRGVAVADRRAGRIAQGSGSVARAARQVAAGTDDVASGTEQVSRGAGRLDAAAGRLSSSAASLAAADEQLAAGTRSTASGAASLASGAARLDDGAGQLADGADQLSSGLASFAKSVPGYSKDQRTALDSVVTTPVTISATAEHRATVQAGLVPVAVAATLWLAGLMLFLVRDALPTGLAWAQAGAWRRVLTRWLPAVGVGVALTLVLLGVIALAGVRVHAPLGFAGLCVLAVLAFSATNQALVALLGPVGRVVALVLAAVQAAAVGGLIPIETAPALFRTLNGVLPLPRFVDGAGQLVLGGSSGGLAGAVVTLVAWTAAGLLVSLLAAARQAPLARLVRARGALRKVDGPATSVG